MPFSSLSNELSLQSATKNVHELEKAFLGLLDCPFNKPAASRVNIQPH